MVARMKAKQRFNEELVSFIDRAKGLRIRAGLSPHRFIGIWAVVVDGRVFVRSWSLKARSWYRTFLKERGPPLGREGEGDGRHQLPGLRCPVQARV